MDPDFSKIKESMFFLLFLLDDRRIQIPSRIRIHISDNVSGSGYGSATLLLRKLELDSDGMTGLWHTFPYLTAQEAGSQVQQASTRRAQICLLRHPNFSAVLRIHEILVRIWIRGSIPPTNGSGCGSATLLLRKLELNSEGLAGLYGIHTFPYLTAQEAASIVQVASTRHAQICLLRLTSQEAGA
jgi:hypothetical protein